MLIQSINLDQLSLQIERTLQKTHSQDTVNVICESFRLLMGCIVDKILSLFLKALPFGGELSIDLGGKCKEVVKTIVQTDLSNMAESSPFKDICTGLICDLEIAISWL